MTELSETVARCYKFIEWNAFWEGRVTPANLASKFLVSTEEAISIFRRYEEHALGNLAFDPQSQTYGPTANFQPKYATLSSTTYLQQAQDLALGTADLDDTYFLEAPECDAGPAVVRLPETEVLRQLMQAIKQRKGVRLDEYWPMGTSQFKDIIPFHLAYDSCYGSPRWFVRSWCFVTNKYRDIIPSRITAMSPSSVTADNLPRDKYWEEFITLVLTTPPQLTVSQVKAADRTYRMENGRMRVTMRLAQAYYFVLRNHLDVVDKPGSPVDPSIALRGRQLVLENLDEYRAMMGDYEPI